jgi:hypothetical protein
LFLDKSQIQGRYQSSIFLIFIFSIFEQFCFDRFWKQAVLPNLRDLRCRLQTTVVEKYLQFKKESNRCEARNFESSVLHPTTLPASSPEPFSFYQVFEVSSFKFLLKAQSHFVIKYYMNVGIYRLKQK